MISSQTIQSCLDELKAITRVDLCVCDLSGEIVAATMGQMDISMDLIVSFADSPADSQIIGVHHLLKILDEGELLYVLVARGSGDDVYMIGRIAVCELQNLAAAYKERFDRNNFFQNLILDNLLLVDIYFTSRRRRPALYFWWKLTWRRMGLSQNCWGECSLLSRAIILLP